MVFLIIICAAVTGAVGLAVALTVIVSAFIEKIARRSLAGRPRAAQSVGRYQVDIGGGAE